MTAPPTAMMMTREGVLQKFKGRPMDAQLFAEARVELKNLRDWDAYFHSTDPERERAKETLRRILDHEP